MKYIIFIITVLFCIEGYAATEKPSALALEWWLIGQGKFKGASVRTQGTKEGKYEIFEWKVKDVPQPTDVEVDKIISDYEVAKAAEEQATLNAKTIAIQKLQAIGITEADLKTILK